MFGKSAQPLVTDERWTVKLSFQFDEPIQIGWTTLFRTIMLCATFAWASCWHVYQPPVFRWTTPAANAYVTPPATISTKELHTVTSRREKRARLKKRMKRTKTPRMPAQISAQ